MIFAFVFTSALMAGMTGMIIHEFFEELREKFLQKTMKTYFRRILRKKHRKCAEC